MTGRPVERRTAERFAPEGLHAQLILELDSSIVTLSSRGMGVRLAFAPAIGTRHEFVLRFGDRVMDLNGVVRDAVAQEHQGYPSYVVGVEFVDLDPDDEAFLARFVEERLEHAGV
ncbi:MAG TPA: PilZ domain-containing protein [Vicinamibacteria bacterium]|nr:PilZ domain-containing protein [Vicinamibacteria bacterium]